MKIKFLVLSICVLFCFSFIGCTANNNGEGNQNQLGSSINPKFDGVPQISAVGELGENILGYPTLSIEITNNSDKNISAINFYVQFYDVYGDITTYSLDANKLYTDNTLVAYSSDTRTWQFYNNKIKSVDLYVYSIYYEDGTEWGDKDATKNIILNSAYKINVNS